MQTIKANKWYYLTLGYGGSESRHVAAVKMTGKTTGGPGMFSLFGNKDGSTMRPLAWVPVWEAIDEEGRTHEIDANDLDGIGIGSIVEAFDHAPDLTPKRLAELREIGRRNAEREKREAEQAAKDRAAAVAECRRKYAYLPHKGEYLRVSKVAANLRAELKRAFPGVKFSVCSKEFSGGNDIRVDWSDGPTVDQVHEITYKYENHETDYTGDYRDYKPHAFNEVFGGTKYLFCTRHMSQATEATLYAEIGVKWSRETDAERQRIFRAFQATPLPVGAEVIGIEDERVTFAEKPTPEDRGTVFGVGVTVSENPGKNGVEIRFAAKPPDATLEALKSAGWRWSRFSRCWYTRASAEARTFAERIAAEG